MKITNIALSFLMLGFAGVQINDPDGALWMVIYLIPAIWAGLAAYKPTIIAKQLPNFLLLASLAAAIAGTLYFWPETPEFWKKEVFWEVETAREGMGLMIVTAVLVFSWVSCFRYRTKSA